MGRWPRAMEEINSSEKTDRSSIYQDRRKLCVCDRFRRVFWRGTFLFPSKGAEGQTTRGVEGRGGKGVERFFQIY